MKIKNMIAFVTVSLLTLLTVSLFTLSVANTLKDNKMDTDKENILKTVKNMTAAFHNKDIDKIMVNYENGAAIMFEPGTAISDPDTIEQMFAGAFQIDPKFTYPKGHEVYIANDLAMHIAPWEMKGLAPDNTEIIKTGLSVAVLRKQSNGSWLMVLDNPNSQVLFKQ